MAIFQRNDAPIINKPKDLPPPRYEQGISQSQLIDAKIAALMPFWDMNYVRNNLQATNPKIGIKSITYLETDDNGENPQEYTQYHFYIFSEKKAVRLEEANRMYVKEDRTRRMVKTEYYYYRDVPSHIKEKYDERKLKDAQREVLLLRREQKKETKSPLSV